MPKKVDDCVKRLMAEGRSQSSAFAICNASIVKETESKMAIQETLIQLENIKITIDGIQDYIRSLSDMPIMMSDDSLPEDVASLLGDKDVEDTEEEET